MPTPLNLTPLTWLPAVSFTLTLPDAVTVVEADPAPYSNTKEILFLNGSTTARIFVKFVVLTGNPLALPAAVSITAANSAIIPASGSLSWCLGPEGCRNPIGTLAFWNANSGSRIALLFLAESGVNLELNVTYIQGTGGGGSG